MSEVDALREQVAGLVAQVTELMARNTELVARNEELVARNKQLEDEVAALRERAGRSSRNSSLPPSKDPPDAPARSNRWAMRS